MAAWQCNMVRKYLSLTPLYDDDYVVERWDKESGLKLVDPEGNEVPNHVINYVPRLGDPAHACSTSKVDVERVIQDLIQTVGETLDEISNEFSHAVSEVTRDILRSLGSP